MSRLYSNWRLGHSWCALSPLTTTIIFWLWLQNVSFLANGKQSSIIICAQRFQRLVFVLPVLHIEAGIVLRSNNLKQYKFPILELRMLRLGHPEAYHRVLIVRSPSHFQIDNCNYRIPHYYLAALIKSTNSYVWLIFPPRKQRVCLKECDAQQTIFTGALAEKGK